MEKENKLIEDRRINPFLLEKISSPRKISRLMEENDFAERNKHKYSSLTKREIQIIKLLLTGFNNPQISKLLFISRRTVEQHRKNINFKLKISSVADLFKFGYAFDLV